MNIYKKWVNKSILELETLDVKKNISICNMGELKVIKKLCSGGSGIVLEAKLNNQDVVVKLCNSVIIGPVYCKYMYTEIYNTLRYSLLSIDDICFNFLKCLGYGVNCCLNLDHTAMNIIYDNPEDVSEYQELIETVGCDTFIILNKIAGIDLSRVSTKYKFTLRQTFELVYSYLCSTWFIGIIQADLHLDNIMIYDSGAGLRINNQIIFNDTSSLVHIDNQSMKEQNNITYGDIVLFEKFINPDLVEPIKNILNEKVSAQKKIQNLILFFTVFTDKPIDKPYNDIKISF